MDFLNDKPKALFQYLLEKYSAMHDIDIDRANFFVNKNELHETLSKIWYDSLENNADNIYEVYNHDYYFVDVFHCFAQYSRPCIRKVLKSPTFDLLKDSKVIVDVGCGLGFSSALLKQIFPKSKVYATNLKGTKQWAFCEEISKDFDLNLIESVGTIKDPIDVVFASEYFEHIINPVDDVHRMIFRLDQPPPKWLIISNSFNTYGTGHFKSYRVGSKLVDQSHMSRLFNKYLRNCGYTQVPSKIFNNTPTIWRLGE